MLPELYVLTRKVSIFLRSRAGSNLRIWCCWRLWQDILDQEHPLSLKWDEAGSLLETVQFTALHTGAWVLLHFKSEIVQLSLALDLHHHRIASLELCHG
jgi:hypothetical protein